MSLSKQFATSKKKEVEGVVIQYTQNDDGTFAGFHVIRMSENNIIYTKALEAASRPYRRQIELGTFSNELANKLMRDVFVKHVLKGWENVPMSDVTGNEKDTGYAPFTIENAQALFERLPDLCSDLQAQAKSAAIFRDEATEQDAKN